MDATGLRSRLLAAAVDILGERGPEGATLRAIARRAGVSHGAPLRHFPSHTALLSEVAADGFRQLETSVDVHAREAGPGSRDRLAAGGRGYVAFALANPGVFGLMWRADLLDFGRPALARHAPAAFGGLTRLVRDCQRDGWRPEADTALLAGSLWATVHGVAQLWLFRVMQAATGAPSVDIVLDTAVALLLETPVRPSNPPAERCPA